MLYKWTLKHCPNVKYVLKTDDDAFVDTYHLPGFLTRHQFDKETDFFLCFVLKGYKPRRNIGDKWFVTRDEYDQDEYPPYCAGPIYVTKTKTMKKVLAKVENMNYLFIDDLLLTGIAAKGITSHYDWSKGFLESHIDSAENLLSPSSLFYTPELLAAINLNSTSILHLHRKAKLCHKHPKCHSLLDQLPSDYMKPEKVSNSFISRSEL